MFRWRNSFRFFCSVINSPNKFKIMEKEKKSLLSAIESEDNIDRAGFIKCMAWAGTGTLCMISGGVLKSFSLSRTFNSGGLDDLGAGAAKGELQFVQISDSHMGFNKPANQDVAGTLKAAVEKIKALPNAPEFLLHTGDISHLSKPDEFDAVDQILKDTGKEVFFVPGEHDVLNDEGRQFLDRYGKGSSGAGWRSLGDRYVSPCATARMACRSSSTVADLRT